jgi:hypothetical protein
MSNKDKGRRLGHGTTRVSPFAQRTARTCHMGQDDSLTGAPPADGAMHTLTARNNSSVPGEQYFSVFPPPMSVTPPELRQIPVAKVSTPTVTGKIRLARLTWWSGRAALALVTLAPGQAIEAAMRTPVTLGSIAALVWEDGMFSVTVRPGDGEGITVTFDGDIPPVSYVGLVVGPAPILVPVVRDAVHLKPDLAPIVSVRFGTPWQWGAPSFSDLSRATTVVITDHEAAIEVGPDNVIRQTA